MTLSAIPEGSACCDADLSPASRAARSRRTGTAAMNVRHTFIEFGEQPELARRVRSFTDPTELRLAGEHSPIQGQSDVKIDVPADVDDFAEASQAREWASPAASPFYGPSGDLFYPGALPGDLPPLPVAEMMAHENLVQYQVPGHEFPWAMMANDPMWAHMWGGIPLPNFVDSSAFKQPDFFAAGGGQAGYGKKHRKEKKQESSPDSSAVQSPNLAPKTTVMLRNLPGEYTRSKILELLEDEGFEGSYDLVYVPMDFSSERSLGYAFVNFISDGDAGRCWATFDRFTEWGVDSENVCEVMWSDPHQGTAALVERYRNSPVMHQSMPAEWKPAYFADGVQVPFPAPTITIKAPKMKKARDKGTSGKQ